MKKIDKLILSAFLGPFILTLAVVVFILLMIFMLRYLDDIFGKNLGFAVIGELMFYFSLNMVPTALPLAVLLSSLIAFGNLGEHFELTAIKSAGISLLRVLRPVLFFIILVTAIAFLIGNYVTPRTNLKAYSLLWDVKQKKPTLDIKEKIFYNGIPGFSIRVEKKDKNDEILRGLMIYNHTEGNGNTDVWLAEEGKMYVMPDNKYMVLELTKGKKFSEFHENTGASGSQQQFVRAGFDKNKIVFSLESFDLNRTKEELFSGHKIMKTAFQLQTEADSLEKGLVVKSNNLLNELKPQFIYFFSDSAHRTRPDTTGKAISDIKNIDSLAKSYEKTLSDADRETIVSTAEMQVNNIKDYLSGQKTALEAERYRVIDFRIERQNKFTQAIACLIMFLIGAPLGAIIKKGGLGVPVLISILFFIVFYLFSIVGRKWAGEEIVTVLAGTWFANIILLPVGVFFLIQAKNDSGILDPDTYKVAFRRLTAIFNRRK